MILRQQRQNSNSKLGAGEGWKRDKVRPGRCTEFDAKYQLQTLIILPLPLEQNLLRWKLVHTDTSKLHSALGSD